MKKYNPKSEKSVVKYAKQLENKSLRNLVEDSKIENRYKGKGKFGQTLEKFYFEYEPNSDAQPDFFEIGVELKASPLKKLSKGQLKSKERVVLNIINYLNIVNETFESSTFWRKNQKILFVFYLWNKTSSIWDFKIKTVGLWDFSIHDYSIIQNDWIFIQNKITEGKAHELSEGDTMYLGACTKGSTAEKSLRIQPNSPIKAKQRAFSFKQGYVNIIIEKLSKKSSSESLKLEFNSTRDFELKLANRLKDFQDKSVEDIQEKLGCSLNIKSKSFFASLLKRMLGVHEKSQIEELEKAEIKIKTVRILKNGKNKESISFPAFKFKDIVRETFEDSEFNNLLEKKYLFAFFKENHLGQYSYDKIEFWHPSFQDRLEAKRVYEHTSDLIANGNIVKGFKTNEKGKTSRQTNFIGSKKSNFFHVRPHGQNSEDTYPLPVADKFSGLTDYTKQCFWINKNVILNLYNGL